MIKKINLEINEDVYESLKERLEKDKLQFGAINILTVDDFANYILSNFVTSSKEFDMLGEQQKEILANLNINDTDITELFKQVTESLSKNNNSDEEEKKETNLDGIDYSKKN